MNKLNFKFLLVLVALVSTSSTSAYAALNCYMGLTQCTTAMRASLESTMGVRFAQACEEQATADYSDFDFTYDRRRHTGYFNSFVDCLQGLRRALSASVHDIAIYSACEHSRGGERTFTGGVTPAGQFCFEYNISE